MSDLPKSSFVESLLAAPAGVALLARLEVEEREDVPWFEAPKNSNHDAVRRGAVSVSKMSFGNLLAMAVSSAEHLAGPWSGQALLSLPYLYQCAPQRRLIAEAVAEHFGSQLCHDADLDAQEWWRDGFAVEGEGFPGRPLFKDFSEVYGNGEFTHSGLWTVTHPPLEINDDLFSAWDFTRMPVTRWRLPIHAGVRLWNVDHPNDWVRLVETYPKVATRPHSGWELPGPNQYPSDTRMLRSLETQHAVRVDVSRHVLPDWYAVAHDFDGVHLSWAGFLTTEGFVSDLSEGGVTMLRYWGSERTLWLRNVFGEPTPLAPPTFSNRFGMDHEIKESQVGVRLAEDRAVLTTLLGR
jgi:hypothetical protein